MINVSKPTIYPYIPVKFTCTHLITKKSSLLHYSH